jgi:hypothetical protein
MKWILIGIVAAALLAALRYLTRQEHVDSSNPSGANEPFSPRGHNNG